MLNIEKLSLQNGFTGTEPEIQKGIARLKLNSAILKGNYHFEQTPAGIVAGVGITGIAASEVSGLTTSNVALTLLMPVTEIISVEANADSVQLKSFPAEEIKIVDAGGTGAASTNTSSENGSFGLTTSATSAGKLTINYVCPVAVGAPSDPNVNHNATLSAGEIHVNALCRVTDVEGAKPNNTSWTVCPMEAIHL